LRFIKPNGDGAASISGELAAVSSSFGARCGGAGVMQRHGFGAEFPRDFFVIFDFLGSFLPDVRVLVSFWTVLFYVYVLLYPVFI
jgi:hypothetical protein